MMVLIRREHTVATRQKLSFGNLGAGFKFVHAAMTAMVGCLLALDYPKEDLHLCFIDDASRVIPHGEFFFQETAASFVQALRLGLSRQH